MKVIISGASGFIGKHTAKLLIDNGIEVFTLGRNQPDIPNIKHIKFDLLSPNFEKIKEIGTIDSIIHCASVMADSSNLFSFSLLNDNLKMCETIIDLCEKLEVKQLINLSSMAVYPNIDGEYSEKDSVRVSDNNDAIYGLSKICAENLYDFMLGKRSKIPVVHLRISQVYGPGMRPDRTYQIMFDELKEKNTISVFSNGERISNFISVFKVVNTILFFLKNLNHQGIYNLGGDNLSYKALAEKLISEYGDEQSEIILVDRGVRSKFHLNSDKLNKLINQNV